MADGLNLAGTGPVGITSYSPAQRYCLRVADSHRAAVEQAIGVTLPTRIGGLEQNEQRRVLCLGPDEWQIEVDDAGEASIEAELAEICPQAPHSLVDISDRELGWRLSGPRAAELLSIGCPRDVSKIAVGDGARTIFDSAQAVLIRESEEAFTLSVWRSFAPHVGALLARGNAEFASGY